MFEHLRLLTDDEDDLCLICEACRGADDGSDFVEVVQPGDRLLDLVATSLTHMKEHHFGQHGKG